MQLLEASDGVGGRVRAYALPLSLPEPVLTQLLAAS